MNLVIADNRSACIWHTYSEVFYIVGLKLQLDPLLLRVRSLVSGFSLLLPVQTPVLLVLMIKICCLHLRMTLTGGTNNSPSDCPLLLLPGSTDCVQRL